MLIQQDQAALIRSTTASILLAAGTIAGSRVEQERTDPVEEGDTPHLIVQADQSAQTDSQAGTALTFLVTSNLVIQALVEDAKLPAAVAKLDTLTAQVKEALFTSPQFTMLMQNIASFRVLSVFKSGGAYITGDARIIITGTWREIYNPNVLVPFAGLNVAAQIGNAPTVVAKFNPPSEG